MRISDWSSDVCSSDLGEKGVAFGGAFAADEVFAHHDRAVLAVLRPGADKRAKREALAHFRGIEGRGGEKGARERIDLTLPEGDGDCVRGGGHGGSGWRGNHSRGRNRRQNESLPKWHFSILSIPRELFGLSIIGTYGKIEVAEIVDFAQKGSVKSAGNNNARRS